MRFPRHLLTAHRREPLMAAMALVAAGMFAGAWIAGPALTHDTEAPAQVPQDRMSYQNMLSRPDPPPYRTATPAFDTSTEPHYAAAARAKAQAELAGVRDDAEDDDAVAEPPRPHGSWRSRNFFYDRHRIY